MAEPAGKDVFRWPARVYWEDTDAGGVVYHAQYLAFMERARSEWMRALGWDQGVLRDRDDQVFVVRADAGIKTFADLAGKKVEAQKDSSALAALNADDRAELKASFGELIEVAYNARCGAARRIALVRLNDPAMSAAFAQEDADPVVRRRLARTLDDRAILERIADADGDASVREAAQRRLDALNESRK